MHNSLDIIIVNWNAGEELLECLESIQEADRTSFQLEKVIVIDNASTDNSVDNLPYFDFPLEIVRNSSNIGFSAACNQGAKMCNASQILFLNPDTRLFPKALSSPMSFMNNNAHIGLCTVQRIDETGAIAHSCFKFPQEKYLLTMMFPMSKLLSRLQHQMIQWPHEQSAEVECFGGAFLLIRRKLFAELGGYDERFFVFFEDFDLAYRAHQLGYKSYFLAQKETQVYHRRDKSSRGTNAIRLFYTIRSRIIYGFLHFKKHSAIILLVASFTIEPVARITRGIFRGSFKEVKEVLRSYIMLFKAFPGIIKIIKSV